MKISVEKSVNGVVRRTDYYSSRVIVYYENNKMCKRRICGEKMFEYELNELLNDVKELNE